MQSTDPVQPASAAVTPEAAARRRSVRLLLTSVALYAALVATHQGEFWPFSIYPMFSVAGRPWSRAVVRELPDDPPAAQAVDWRPVGRSELPGVGFGLKPRGIEAIDVANFVHKTRVWTPARAEALAGLFGPHRAEGPFMVYRVDGKIGPDDDIDVSYRPYLLITPDEVLLNPELTTERVGATGEGGSP